MTLRGTGTRTRADLGRMTTVLPWQRSAPCSTRMARRLWWYVRSLLGNRAVSELVTEWAAPRLGTPEGTIFFSILAVAVIALMLRRRQVPLGAMAGARGLDRACA